NMSAFGDAGQFQGALESLLQAAAGERMNAGSGLEAARAWETATAWSGASARIRGAAPECGPAGGHTGLCRLCRECGEASFRNRCHGPEAERLPANAAHSCKSPSGRYGRPEYEPRPGSGALLPGSARRGVSFPAADGSNPE